MSIKEINLPSSGRTIRMKSANGAKILLQFQRLYPPPMPKYQEVNYGTEKKPDIRGEYNYASPEYLAQKEAYAVFQSQYFGSPASNIEMLTECLILNESEKAEIEAWIKENGNPHKLTSKQIFFEEILSIDEEDIFAIRDATSSPAPEEVRTIANSFQG